MLLLCSRCGKVVFLTDINAVIFTCFLSCVLGVFNSPVATPARGLSRVFDYDLYWRKRACFAYLCHHPWSHFIKLLNRALFVGPCHCSHIFLACLAFRVHVAGDLNKTISFVGVFSISRWFIYTFS